jgi:hypothetical protein
LDSSAPEFAPSGKWSSTATAAEFWSEDSLPLYDSLISASAPGRASAARAFATTEPASAACCRPSTSSVAVSPAKTFRTPASAPASTENAADCGPSTRESFASFDRATSSWRTSQLCFTGEWSVFSETWPPAGTMRNGRAYELPTLARRTEGSASGLLPTPRAIYGEHPGMVDRGHLTGAIHFWPTPTAEDSQCKGNHPGAVDSLHAAVKLWPTPVANMGERGGRGDLLAIVRGMPNKHSGFFPTPMPSDVEGGRTTKGKHRQNETGLRRAALWPTPTADDANNATRASGVQECFRTPSSRDWKGQSAASWRERETGDPTPTLPDQIGGQLNPTWVEWLMGYPLGWTDCGGLETRSCRKSRNGSAGES